MAGDPGVLAQPKSTQKLQQQHPQAALGRCRMASWGVAPVHSLHPPSTMGWKEVPNFSTGTSNRPAFVYAFPPSLGYSWALLIPLQRQMCITTASATAPIPSSSLPTFDPASTDPPPLIQGVAEHRAQWLSPCHSFTDDQWLLWLLFLLTCINRSQIFFKLSSGGSQETGKWGEEPQKKKKTPWVQIW